MSNDSSGGQDASPRAACSAAGRFLLRRVAARSVLAAIGIAGLAVPAAAQDWPARPVRIVAPFAPGGSADTLGRLVAQRLSVRFKQNFVVDNRAGAGGTVGSELVADSTPDGYTLLVSGIASHAIAPAMSKVPSSAGTRSGSDTSKRSCGGSSSTSP